MLEALFSSFITITLAEMGDKTQLITLIYGIKTRRFLKVFLVSITALALVTVISILIGYSISFLLKKYINYISGAMFITIGLWFLICRREEKERIKVKDFYYQFALVFSSEFGDKTQFLCISLAAKYSNLLNLLFVYIGALLGFMVTNAIALFIGKILERKVSIKLVNFIAGLVFIAFGICYILGL